MRKKSKRALRYESRKCKLRAVSRRDVDWNPQRDDVSWMNDEVDELYNRRTEVDLKMYDDNNEDESEEEVYRLRSSSDEGEDQLEDDGSLRSFTESDEYEEGDFSNQEEKDWHKNDDQQYGSETYSSSTSAYEKSDEDDFQDSDIDDSEEDGNRRQVDLKMYDNDYEDESEEEVYRSRSSSDDGEDQLEDDGSSRSFTESDEYEEGDFSNQKEKDWQKNDDQQYGSETYSSSTSVYENGDEDDFQDADNNVIDSDIDDSEEDGLPDAEAWGQKRSMFYNTDYAGDEHAGFHSSDEEPADLEEKEAIKLQKSLNEWISGVHDQFPSLETWQSGNSTVSTVAEKELVDDRPFTVPIDVQSMTKDQKVNIIEQRSPELLELIKEFSRLAPLMKRHEEFCKLMKNNRGRSTVNNVAMKIFEIMGNYLLNVAFYILLKAKRVDTTGHPAIERIIEWKKLLNAAMVKWPSFQRDVDNLLSCLSTGESIPPEWNAHINLTPAKIVFEDNDDHLKEDNCSTNSEEIQTVEGDNAEGLDKRSITYEMKKNKGLMPKRKREQRNPRVKHRNRYRKAVKRVRSQRPEVRREINRYGGESRGINPYLVRSVKFR